MFCHFVGRKKLIEKYLPRPRRKKFEANIYRILLRSDADIDSGPGL